jgi:endonuclease/exonuclease/phosphatase family metal-dependent hydrolase
MKRLISGFAFFLLLSCGQNSHLSSDNTEPNSLRVMSYNVENLWDLVKDSNKQNYDDYDLKKSNYGKKTPTGQPSYMAVKIENIIRVIKDFDQPEIVALQEVETLKALEELVEYNNRELLNLGYKHYKFPSISGAQPAVGNAVLSKWPIRTVKNIYPLGSSRQPGDAQRPILRVEITLPSGEPFFVYNNHWKSKSGPESKRIAYARGLVDDIQSLGNALYIVVGDLNSNYNESETILNESRLNDSQGQTGINDILLAGSDTSLKSKEHFNPYFDLNDDERRSVYSGLKYGWGSFDHMIMGQRLVEDGGITYIGGSFEIAPINKLPYLWTNNGEEDISKRWITDCNKNRTKCTHKVGGYSDHLPIRARFLLQ